MKSNDLRLPPAMRTFPPMAARPTMNYAVLPPADRTTHKAALNTGIRATNTGWGTSASTPDMRERPASSCSHQYTPIRPRRMSCPSPIAPVQRRGPPHHVRRPRILFYHKNAPYYGFTNFSDHPVIYHGKEYPTSEHLFQSFKVSPRECPDRSYLKIN